MNIFYLDKNPTTCAEHHCDKHVVKMLVEYAQLMSTAHRVCDGNEYIDRTKNNRKIKRWRVNGSLESVLYKASHVNHPSNIWVRDSVHNYNWLYDMWCELHTEYTKRYNKQHKSYTLLNELLAMPPSNISTHTFTQPTQAMPDDVKDDDSVTAYRNYYNKYKKQFATWKTQVPSWFVKL